ncbi:PTPDL family protein [Haloferula sp.]|uniref:PTPDL family protein n=1 Tax=Haloferula sp. TaxID=2497595 RepID=UPI00329BD648
MKLTTFLLIPVLACLSHADTIRMRNGIEYEGEILAEKDDHYVVKIQVTKSIRDERKIPKTEILEIVAEKKDKQAFEKIKTLVPTPDLLTRDQYDSRTEAVESFMAEFSKSGLLKKADELLKVLDAERSVVAAGGVKFEGKMIEGSDRAARAYPLDARIAASKVTRHGDDGNTTLALRAWSELETRFGTSQAYIDTIPYAQKMMTSHLKALDKNLASFDARLKKREDGLARIDERDRERTKRAIAEKDAAYERQIEEEKEKKIKWLSLDPYHKRTMTDTKRQLETALGKLERFDSSKVPNADDAWNDAWETLTGVTDRQAATAVVSAARAARLPKEYLDILEAKVPEN